MILIRTLIIGNAGSGKTTMARALIGNRDDIAHLSLDDITWDLGPVRKPLEESLAELMRFIDAHDQWIIEGCYGDLIEAALPSCTELRFINPGVEACVARCRARQWEPEKFASKAEQDAMLVKLIEWVREYETRDDEFGLACHRAIFDSFSGRKTEYA